MDLKKWFDRLCMDLIFLLMAFLILFGGIQAAKAVIDFAKTEQIEIVNNVLEELSSDSQAKLSPRKLQDILIKYIKAFFQAMAEFEFLPRNDFGALAQIISSIPAESEVLSFSYLGRDLTISTVQPDPTSVLEMVKSLERSMEFSNVVYSYYIDKRGNCIAEITLVAYHYDEKDWGKELYQAIVPEEGD